MKVNFTFGDWSAGCDRDDISEANVILVGDVVIGYVVDAIEIRERRNHGKAEAPGCQAGPDSLDEVDANARVMAAGPALYYALRDLIGVAKRAMGQANSDGASYDIEGELRDAKNALMKATGESEANQ